VEAADPTFVADHARLDAAMTAERDRLAKLLESAADDDAIMKQVEVVMTAHNEVERRVAQHLLRIRKHLTPQQQKRLMDLAAEGVRQRGYRWRRGQQGGNAETHGPGHGGRGPGWRRGQGQGHGTGQSEGAAGPGARNNGHQEAIHQLAAAHEKIQRQVKDIAGGIEATTTSKDPAIAALIQTHVAQMKTRLASGQPVRHWDPLFRELFRHSDKIELEATNIEGGVRVVETSKDPEVVKLIRQHARRGVSEFVAEGPARLPQPTPLPEGYRDERD
jgi:hypothetical protein